MKSKKVLAQLAALSLLFGVAGVSTAWADSTQDTQTPTQNDVAIQGETVNRNEGNAAVKDTTQGDEKTVKYTIDGGTAGKTVAGLYIDAKDDKTVTMTANNVNFVDATNENREVAVDGGSTLNIKGGSVSVAGLNAFAADGGSTITTDGTKIASSVFANNSAITLKDSTTSSFALYAGNEWGEGDVADGLGAGTLTIDGGTASAKNVLVQNKGTITVKNGAVLDVTGDTSDNDNDTKTATGLAKGGTITVRAWGPTNSSTSEKSNNDEINKLYKASEFVAEKATVKANAISVAGDKYVPEENTDTDTEKYENWAKFSATGSTIEAKDINFGKYSVADFSDKTQIKADTITVEGVFGKDVEQAKAIFNAKDSTINAGTISFGNSGYGKINDSTVTAKALTLDGGEGVAFVKFNGGSATIDEVTVSGCSQVDFNNMTTTTKKITVEKSGVLEAWGAGSFAADKADVKGYLEFYNDVKATLGEVTATGEGATIMMVVGPTKENENPSGPDVTVSKLVLKDKAKVDLSAGKLTANSIDAAEGTTIEIKDQITEGSKEKIGSGTLSTKSDQVYTNAADEKTTESGEVKNKAIKFTGSTLELTDATYTLDYAKAAKAAMANTENYGSTELSMTGKAVDEDGEEIKKVSIEDASLIGNLSEVTVTSDKNVLIGVNDSTKLDNETIDEVKVEKKVADSVGAKNLELTDAADGNVGIVITNDKKLTLAGDEDGSLIKVVNDKGAAAEKDVKVIVGTEKEVVTGAETKGTFTIGKADGAANTLKGEVVVNEDSDLTINGTTTITKAVTLNNGAINVAEGGSLTTKNLNVAEEADDSGIVGAVNVTDTLNVGEDAIFFVGDEDTAGHLVVNKLTGEGAVFIDSTWKDGVTIKDASDVTVTNVSEGITNVLAAAHNSKLSLGTSDATAVDTIFAKTGETWGDKGILSAVYIAKNVTLDKGILVADGSLKAGDLDESDDPGVDAGGVSFGKNSILLVNGEAVTEKAAISGVTESDIDSTSKLYIDGAERGQTYKILEGAAANSEIEGWDDKNIITDNALLRFEGELGPKAEETNARATEKAYYNVTTTVKTMKEAYGDKVIAPSVYDKALDGDNDLADFALKAAKYAVNATTDAQVSALNSAVELSELAGAARGTYTTAGLVNDAVADHMSIVHEYTHDKDVWAKYIHNKEDVDGLSIAGSDASYKNQYNGIVVGADLYHSDKATVGVALTYGDGDISGNTLAAHTENDATYYGASIYGGIHHGNTAFLGDISYLHSKNDITQTNSTETITGSEKSNAFSIGLRAEQSVKAGEGQFVPYVGLRYMHLSNDSYTDSLGMNHDGGDLNLWLLPIGVKYSMDAKHGSWTLRPIAEIGYVWNMGDRDAIETVSFDGTSNSFGYDVTDNGSYLGRLGFEAEKGNTTFGFGYQYQKGDSVKTNRWSASVNYRF